MLIVQNYITKEYYVSDTTFLRFGVYSCVEYKGHMEDSVTSIFQVLSREEQIPLNELVDLVNKVWYCKVAFRPELNLSSIVISEFYSNKEAQKWLDEYIQKLKGE